MILRELHMRQALFEVERRVDKDDSKRNYECEMDMSLWTEYMCKNRDEIKMLQVHLFLVKNNTHSQSQSGIGRHGVEQIIRYS